MLKNEPSNALIGLTTYAGPTMNDDPVNANIWQPAEQSQMRPRQ